MCIYIYAVSHSIGPRLATGTAMKTSKCFNCSEVGHESQYRYICRCLYR